MTDDTARPVLVSALGVLLAVDVEDAALREGLGRGPLGQAAREPDRGQVARQLPRHLRPARLDDVARDELRQCRPRRRRQQRRQGRPRPPQPVPVDERVHRQRPEVVVRLFGRRFESACSPTLAWAFFLNFFMFLFSCFV